MESSDPDLRCYWWVRTYCTFQTSPGSQVILFLVTWVWIVLMIIVPDSKNTLDLFRESSTALSRICCAGAIGSWRVICATWILRADSGLILGLLLDVRIMTLKRFVEYTVSNGKVPTVDGRTAHAGHELFVWRRQSRHLVWSPRSSSGQLISAKISCSAGPAREDSMGNAISNNKSSSWRPLCEVNGRELLQENEWTRRILRRPSKSHNPKSIELDGYDKIWASQR